MKLPETQYVLDTNINPDKRSEITIDPQDSSIILTFLRDNIYELPLESFIKEVISNAIDVHVINKVPDPIDITLPNPFSSDLVIRDYGTGLSKEFMLKKYTRAGLSTKNDNNFTLGGYGIGRLSPLSYSDIYHVESYYEGILYKYIVALHDDQGRRRINLVNIYEQETDEPSGLKVIIPIKSKDFNKVETLVRKYCYFVGMEGSDISAPKINGETADTAVINLQNTLDFNKGNEDYVTRWFTLKAESLSLSSFHGYDEYIIILIGGVPHFMTKMALHSYRNISERLSIHRKEPKNYIYRLDLQYLVIEIPIGSVTLTASKDIQASDITNRTISTAVDIICSDIETVFRKAVSEATTLNEAMAVRPFTSGIEWKGVPISDNISLKKLFPSMVLSECSISYRSYRSIKYSYRNEIENGFRRYLINDVKPLSAESMYTILNLEYGTEGNLLNVVLRVSEDFDNSELKIPLLSELLGRKEIEEAVNPSKPKVTRSSRTPIDPDKITAYKIRGDSSLLIKAGTNKVRVYPKDIRFYLLDEEELVSKYERRRNSKNDFNLLSFRLGTYIVKEKDLSKLNPEAISIEKYIVDSIDRIRQVEPLLEDIWEFLDICQNYNYKDLQELFTEESDIKVFIDRLSTYVNYVNHIDLLCISIYRDLFMNKDENKSNFFIAEWERLIAKYPLIFCWGIHRFQSLLYTLTSDPQKANPAVSQYIMMVNMFSKAVEIKDNSSDVPLQN